MIKIPIVQQTNDYGCSEACVKALLQYHGIKKISSFASPIDGAAPRTIENVLRINGYNVVAGNMDWNAVKYYLRRGIPVITCYDSHYVILVGTEKRSIIMMNPLYSDYQKISIKSFKDTWWDWDSMGTPYRSWCIIGF
jgi:ABC-type bacteriocin/lantibiotic exporter with double-glycine peptidase domain